MSPSSSNNQCTAGKAAKSWCLLEFWPKSQTQSVALAASCFCRRATRSLLSLPSDLFLVTPSQDLPPQRSCNHFVPLWPDNTLRASVFAGFLPALRQPQPLPCPYQLSTLTNPTPPHSSFACSISSQPLLTSPRQEICLSILIPLRQEFWIFITRINPILFW